MVQMSVIVPFQNAEKYIESCINSLLCQDYSNKDYEIIFIDNNSTDRSAMIVGQYDMIKLLNESSPGSYAARNLGIKSARGNIIAFTDADCLPCEGWLSGLEQVLSTSPVLLVQGGQRFSKKQRDYIFWITMKQRRISLPFPVRKRKFTTAELTIWPFGKLCLMK
ncbi:glycosyltransferase family A protein [candidate division CSSED10-310 bacterium]|uniref:Glycosyltransferase family A protein n=1 Tax=candidate division CSSED10-310 bacterium TaxID=2855610 RepID=A0ABV6Z383_UNCC1